MSKGHSDEQKLVSLMAKEPRPRLSGPLPETVLLRDGTLLTKKGDAYEVTSGAEEVLDRIREAVQVEVEVVPKKERLNMFIDEDVMEYFYATGRGYQTRINAVLKSYVAARRKER